MSRTQDINLASLRPDLTELITQVQLGQVYRVRSYGKVVAGLSAVEDAPQDGSVQDLSLKDFRARVTEVMSATEAGACYRLMSHSRPVAALLSPTALTQLVASTMVDLHPHMPTPSLPPSLLAEPPAPLSGKEHRMLTLSFWNEAGGATKTSTTCELAYNLSQRRNPSGELNRVLLIDLDPQRSLTRRMGLLDDPVQRQITERLSSSLYMVMQDPEDRLPEPMVPTVLTNLRVYPSNIRLRNLDATLIHEDDLLPNLRAVLARLGDQYDYCLIDTPPSNGGLTRAALVAADWAVIATPTNIKGIENLENVVGVLGQCRRINPNLRLAAFIPTIHHPNQIEDRKVISLLKDKFSLLAPTLSPITSRPALFSGVVPGRTAIGFDYPKHVAVTELNVVLDELLSIVQPVVPTEVSRPQVAQL